VVEFAFKVIARYDYTLRVLYPTGTLPYGYFTLRVPYPTG